MGEVYWATYVDGLIDNMKICDPQEVDDLGHKFSWSWKRLEDIQ
jgi:hypothetical protein